MIELVCMRLANMTRVHPQQITARCSNCGETVGIYPSGQRVLRDFPDQVKLLCEICKTPGRDAVLAPGAIFEPLQSRDADD